MTKQLLYLGLLGITATAWGAPLDRSAKGVTIAETVAIKENVSQIAKAESGKTMKRLPSELRRKAAMRQGLNPRHHGIKATSKADETVFFESFEGTDGTDITWLPEGWTRETFGSPDLEPTQTWSITASMALMGAAAPADGDFYMGVSFSTDKPQDEWLISPVISTLEGQELSFNWFAQPLFLFGVENIDWETMQYVGEKTIAANMEVYLREAENAESHGEWVKVFDLASMFMNYTAEELMSIVYTQMPKENISLGDFSGKKLQVGFRYVGQDGDTMMVDAVSVAYPALNAIYSLPYSTQFFGFSDNAEWTYANFSSAIYPVFSPIYWMNMSENEVNDVTYSWAYLDPDTSDYVSYTGENLEVTYHPDYTSDFTTRNNLFYMPTLTASASGYSDGSYQAPYNYFQAGGAADFEFKDAGLVHIGLLPFAPQVSDLGGITLDYEAAGDIAMPLFGHNANTGAWWTNHFFDGEAKEGDSAQVVSLINFMYPEASPMVVKGGWVNAKGTVSDNAEFKYGIYPLNDNLEPAETPLVEAVCKGSEVRKNEDFLVIPFTFAEPFVVDDTYPAYVVKFSGFNSDECEYFLPMQSLKPNIDQLCFGFVELAVESPDYGSGYTFIPMANFEGPYGEMLNAFCMNLDGYYPWLKTDTEAVKVDAAGTPVTIEFDSYYDAEELSVKCPTGVYVKEAKGRYGNTEIVIAHDLSEVIAEGDLVVSAPGVEAVVKVSETTGVNAVASSSKEISSASTLTGVSVDKNNLEKGVYVVKYTDGTVGKIIVK